MRLAMSSVSAWEKGGMGEMLIEVVEDEDFDLGLGLLLAGPALQGAMSLRMESSRLWLACFTRSRRL